MADWDPFAVDESGDGLCGDTSNNTGEETGQTAKRISKQDLDDVMARVRQKLVEEEPWAALSMIEPDLLWHTPTCDCSNWRHHDVKLEMSKDGGVAYIIFNRGNENNTLQDTIGFGINDALYAMHNNKDVRVSVWTGEGRMYCAGGDPKGWQAAALMAKGVILDGDGTVGVRIPDVKPQTEEVQYHLHELAMKANEMGAFPDGNPNIGRICAALQWNTWCQLPHVSICLVNGSAMGGGVGCVCCCDIIVALKKAYITLSEVKIGVIPATISPYVVRKLGVANCKRLMCTAENMTAKRAHDLGMVDVVVENMKEGHKVVNTYLEELTKCAPKAVDASKRLVVSCSYQNLKENLLFYTRKVQAAVDASEEYKIGIEANKAGKQVPWQAAKMEPLY